MLCVWLGHYRALDIFVAVSRRRAAAGARQLRRWPPAPIGRAPRGACPRPRGMNKLDIDIETVILL